MLQKFIAACKVHRAALQDLMRLPMTASGVPYQPNTVWRCLWHKNESDTCNEACSNTDTPLCERSRQYDCLSTSSHGFLVVRAVMRTPNPCLLTNTLWSRR